MADKKAMHLTGRSEMKKANIIQYTNTYNSIDQQMNVLHVSRYGDRINKRGDTKPHFI